MLLEQVRPHDHADVGQRQEELVVLIDRHQRSRNISVHHADVHDLPRIDVAVQTTRLQAGHGRVFVKRARLLSIRCGMTIERPEPTRSRRRR